MIKVLIGNRNWVTLLDKSGCIYKDNLTKYCDYLGLMEIKNNKLPVKNLSKFVCDQYEKYLVTLENMVRINGIYYNQMRLQIKGTLNVK